MNVDNPDCLCSWDDIAVAKAINAKEEVIGAAHDLAVRAVRELIRAGEELDALRASGGSPGLRDAMDGVVVANGFLDRLLEIVTGSGSSEDDRGCECVYGLLDLGEAA